MRKSLARSERLCHHLDGFQEARVRLLDRYSKACKLVVAVATPDAEIEPAV
jgi:hypothetical protein